MKKKKEVRSNKMFIINNKTMDNLIKAGILKRLQTIIGIENGIWGSRTDMFLGNIIEILSINKKPVTIDNIVNFYKKPSELGTLSIPEYNRIVNDRYCSSANIIDLIDENVSEDIRKNIV